MLICAVFKIKPASHQTGNPNVTFVRFPASEAAARVGAGEGKSDRDVAHAQRAGPWTEPDGGRPAAAGVAPGLFVIAHRVTAWCRRRFTETGQQDSNGECKKPPQIIHS